MPSHDEEEYPVEKVDNASSDKESFRDGTYAREELLDPAKEETLHRGLSARQISMIAVCSLSYSVQYMC